MKDENFFFKLTCFSRFQKKTGSQNTGNYRFLDFCRILAEIQKTTDMVIFRIYPSFDIILFKIYPKCLFKQNCTVIFRSTATGGLQGSAWFSQTFFRFSTTIIECGASL